MFCCSRTAKRPSDDMQFHPTHKLIILSGAPDRRIAFPELVARSRRTSTVLTSLMRYSGAIRPPKPKTGI